MAWSPDGRAPGLRFRPPRQVAIPNFITDVWLCAPDGSQLRSTDQLAERRAHALRRSGALHPLTATSVCCTAVEMGPGRPRDARPQRRPLVGPRPTGPRRRRRLTEAEAVQLTRGATFETTPHGALVAAEHRGAVELLLVPYDGRRASGADVGSAAGRGHRSHGVDRGRGGPPTRTAAGNSIATGGRRSAPATSFAAVPSPLPAGGDHGHRARTATRCTAGWCGRTATARTRCC